jgi:hypothetical protein
VIFLDGLDEFTGQGKEKSKSEFEKILNMSERKNL